jgi:enoyl-CoA hydratase/carnithine racemase
MAHGPARIGLNETQVGLAVPDAIQHLMRRVVGVYRAERLVVAGAMLDAETAARIGLVDELTDIDHVATRARAWLEELLALPRAPMLATRKLARADLVAALAAFGDADLDRFLAQWNDADTQAALRALVARLRK